MLRQYTHWLFVCCLLWACSTTPADNIHEDTAPTTANTVSQKDTLQPAAKARCFAGADTVHAGTSQGCSKVFLYKYLSKDTVLKIYVSRRQARLNSRGTTVELGKNNTVYQVRLAVYPSKLPENKIRTDDLCAPVYLFDEVLPAEFLAEHGRLSIAVDPPHDGHFLACARLQNVVFHDRRLKRPVRIKDQLFWKARVEDEAVE